MEPQITIPLSDYDRMKFDISKLYDFHNLIRKVTPLVMGQKLTEQESISLVMDFQHFHREYPNE